ncbi:MAG: serine hydrolase domain-containing protein [Planctomycetota bacterium]
MRKKTFRMVMLVSATICIGLVAVATSVGYFIYRWLKVDPIVVSSDASDIDRVEAVEGWLHDQFENDRFNGGVLVIRDGKVLLSKTCGYTDDRATHRLDNHTAFRLASVSKQFTAAGVLRLAEMDLLDLDDPVAEHLEDFPFENVSVRHLLNQTSGIPDEYMDRAEEHRETVGDVLTISKAVELVIRRSKPSRPPGDAMEYSNTNYVLLAGVIEAVSGKSFERFMSEELLQPIGMNDTRVWNLLSDQRSPNQASDFDQIDDDRTPIEPTWLDGVAGDGAVFSSLNDFVIWDRFWYGNSRVSNALLEQAFERPKLKDGSRSDYGFGWVLERKRQWHNGAWLGANTYIVRYPKTRSCLVVLDNSSNLRLDRIANEIEETLKPIFTDD